MRFEITEGRRECSAMICVCCIELICTVSFISMLRRGGCLRRDDDILEMRKKGKRLQTPTIK